MAAGSRQGCESQHNITYMHYYYEKICIYYVFNFKIKYEIMFV